MFIGVDTICCLVGEFKRQQLKGYIVKDDDFKLAYVSLVSINF
jgi:hypothetical protein